MIFQDNFTILKALFCEENKKVKAKIHKPSRFYASKIQAEKNKTKEN